MAEELEMGMEQSAEMLSNASAADIAQDLNVESALEMDSAALQAQNDTPASFDINSIVPGGPGDGFGTPSAPPKPNISGNNNMPSDFMSAMTQVIDSNANEIFVERYEPKSIYDKVNPVVGPKTRYAGKDLDMFRYQDDFDPQGFNYFNPDKQKGYIEQETWGSALGKGFDSFATRFGNTFTDSFASYGRMFDAVVGADWSKLKYSEGEMIDANFDEYKESMKNFVFVPPEEEDDIWSKRSVSEFVGNAGFALGTFAALGLELVGDAVLTAVTGGGGIGSFGATAARFGAKEAVVAGTKAGIKQSAKGAAFRFTDFVADMGKGAFHLANQSTDALSAAGKVTNQANQARKVATAGKVGSDALRQSMKEVFDIYTLNMRNIIKSKSFTQLAGNIAKGTPLLGTGIRYGEKIAAGAKGGLSTGKLVGIGLQGARRMVQEFNMSSTEANFEAITAYGSTLDMMVEQYRADHDGENPPATEFAKMRELSMKSSSASYNTNLGILLATNRLQFGSLFNRFAGANKWTKELLQEGAENVLGTNRMWKSSKLLGKTYEKGFFGTYGLLGKISKDFGRKQALYEFGKQFSKDVLRFEVTEGLQENLQEMTGSAWKNYYAGQYNGIKYTLGEAFEKGLDEQFTKQGLRTFLQGALTGSMIRPVTASVSKFTNYMQEKSVERSYKDNPSENPYVKMREQLKRDINLQNDVMQQMSNGKLEDTIVNFRNQVDSSLRQTEAAAKGLQYEWQNGQDNSVLSGALAANRTGSIAVYQQAIREMGKVMSNEEFEAAFGVKLEDTKYETVADFTSAMAKDVKKYSDTIDGIRKKVSNLPDPLMYEKGSKNRLVATIMHNAQEEAIRIIALNTIKASRASERAEKISQELLQIPSFAGSSEYALRVLTNPDMFKGETGNMLADIKLLEESLNVLEGDQKVAVQEKIKDKKKLVEVYDKWLGFWEDREQILKREDETSEGEVREKVKDTFVGVSKKVDEYDDNKVLIKKDATIYSLDDEEIVKVFREFINLKNKEMGNATVVSEEDLRNAFDKIVDFIRLDNDAKDYMRAMDMMYNPEYYRAVLTNIQDGRFKYELLEFVDSVNERVINAIGYVVSNSDLDDDVEKLQLLIKLHTEVNKAITDSEYYKNLILITIDENLGLDNATFAQENVEKLNTLIQDKIAEILDKYAPSVMSNEVSDEDYAEFQKTKKASGILKTIIARKLASKENLTDKQAEIHEAFKTEIDAIVERLASTSEGVEPGSKVSQAKDALVESGEFDMTALDAMSEDDVLKLALDRNLITAEEVAEDYTGKIVEVISDEVYNEFQSTGNVDSIVLEAIATRDLEGIEITEREKEIMQEYAAEITDIQNIMEDERLRNEEENAPNVDPLEEEIPQVLKQEDDVEEKTTDPLEGSNLMTKDEEQLQNLLQGLTPDDAVDMTKDPFIVTGDATIGFNIVSRDGLVVNTEPIETEERALELAANLNATRSDIDWATIFLGNLSEDEDAKVKTSKFVQSSKRSLSAYNKANETTLQTLEEYSKIPEGKRKLEDIKEAVLTNVPLKDVEARRKKAIRQAEEQIDLFENTTSGVVGSPALPLQSVQDLFDRLESASEGDATTKAQKADIENRRRLTTVSDEVADENNYDGYSENSISPAGSNEWVKNGEWYGTYINKNGEKEQILANSEKELLDVLNAKYNAEIDALKQQPISDIEAQKADLENEKKFLKEKFEKDMAAHNAKYKMSALKSMLRPDIQQAEVNESYKIELLYKELVKKIDEKIAKLAATTTADTTADIERKQAEIESLEKQKQDLLKTQPTQSTTGKTYQELLNEKWPDTSGYLSTPLGDNLFNNAESKFIEGKHLYEIRPVGNGKFEYKFINNKNSFTRAIPYPDRYVKVVTEELNQPNGDTIVTIQPGILRKEGNGFVVEKKAEVFYANSNTINNKVGATTATSTGKVDTTEIDAKITKAKEELSAARLAAINESSVRVAQAMSQKNSKFVSEEQVSEDTVLDQLRKINSCFK